MGTKTALAAFLLAGMSLASFSQSFSNLDFEQATLVPVPGGYTGEVQIGPALPGWSVFIEEPFVLYDDEFLDSAGVCIFDSLGSIKAFQANFTVILEGGFSLYWGPLPPDRLSSTIAQTGLVPAWANTLLFDAWVMDPAYFAVSLGPFCVLAAYTNYNLYAVDVSGLAGQTVALAFTALPSPPPGPAISIVYLDDIRFSSSPLAAVPFILTPPRSQTVDPGSNVVFTVFATGYPPPAFQWFFNGTNAIAGAMSTVLELTNLQASQFGAYTVVITNAYGAVTSPPAMLTMDPFILVQPQGQSVNAGQTASFGVQAGGSWPLTYQWLKNAAALNDGGEVAGAQTATLTVSNVLGGDTGGYSVIVSNGYGTATSQVATLMVRDPVITAQPVNHSVGTGGTVSFAAGAAGTPSLMYQWLLNGRPIAGASSSNLQLTNIQFSQSGAYSVFVTNVLGSATSAPALLSVFPQLTYTVLHKFTGNDGASPRGSLVSFEQTLYGTTYGSSTLFKINMDGSGYALLHRFTGPDGAEPRGALTLADAMLYGATEEGGSGGDPGTLFKISTDGGGFTLLREFTGSDGRFPDGSLVLSGATLYGATEMGGSSGAGTVFKLNTDGSGQTVLHNFTGYPNDGYRPLGGLALSGTTLYGATGGGGSYGPPSVWGDAGYGTLFKVNTDGSGYTVLKQFTGSDGSTPMGGFVSSGTTLYGITEGGYSADGTYSRGTVFKINTDGSGYSLLKEFAGEDGLWPQAGLLLDGTTLYGTTFSGGIANYGVVFALSLPLPNILMPPASQTAEAGSSASFSVRAEGDPSMTYQWFFNGTTSVTGAATNPGLYLTSVQAPQSGAYTVVVSNAFGAVTSPPVMMSVIPVVERRMVPALTLMGQPESAMNLQDAETLGPSPNWVNLDNVALTNTSQWYFDLSASLPPQRFYRAWHPGPSTVAPALGIHMVPALALTGTVGSAVRVDYINQFGPTDAWVTLATVTLTNTSQLYFDVSAIGQAPRLWRLTPVPVAGKALLHLYEH